MIIFQLFTFGNAIMIFVNLTCFNLAFLYALFDVHYPDFIVYIYLFIRIFSILFGLSIVFHACINRILTEFVWKSIKPINDKIIMVFLTANITFQSSLFSIMLIFNGNYTWDFLALFISREKARKKINFSREMRETREMQKQLI